jgi:hypothetical protein
LLFTVSFAQARHNAGKSLMLNLFSDSSIVLLGLSSQGHLSLCSWLRRSSSSCCTVRGLWNIAPDLLTTRLKDHNTQVTEYSWFQLYMLHLVGKSPDMHIDCSCVRGTPVCSTYISYGLWPWTLYL